MSHNWSFPKMPFMFSLLLLALNWSRASSSSTVTVRPADSKPNHSVGLAPDPFVSAAPLIVAAVCADGVILVAVHTSFEQEPLLLDFEAENATTLSDLPASSRGPFRIHAIDSYGTALMSAGWRADGQTLTDYCRSVASEEVAVFGQPRISVDYGNHMASEASLWMAQCAVSDRVRSLSCVGLLASCGASIQPGFLWLVDATSAHRVRAHAVGGGQLAGIVNAKLEGKDWLQWDAPEACRKILELLKELDLPAQTRVELASVGCDDSSGKRQMQRLFSSRLFGATRR